MFDTPNEWIVLALTLLGGLLLGLALHPGGRKWRDRYNAERDAHAAARRDHEAQLSAAETRVRELDAERARYTQSDARIAEIERERDARYAELTRDRDLHNGELARSRESLSLAQARIRELERENDRLAQAARTAPAPVAASPVATPAGTPVAPAEPAPLTRRVVGGSRSGRGWFDWGPGDDPRARRG